MPSLIALDYADVLSPAPLLPLSRPSPGERQVCLVAPGEFAISRTPHLCGLSGVGVGYPAACESLVAGGPSDRHRASPAPDGVGMVGDLDGQCIASNPSCGSGLVGEDSCMSTGPTLLRRMLRAHEDRVEPLTGS